MLERRRHTPTEALRVPREGGARFHPVARRCSDNEARNIRRGWYWLEVSSCWWWGRGTSHSPYLRIGPPVFYSWGPRAA
jgi:hypothetical protein